MQILSSRSVHKVLFQKQVLLTATAPSASASPSWRGTGGLGAQVSELEMQGPRWNESGLLLETWSLDAKYSRVCPDFSFTHTHMQSTVVPL